MSSISKTQLRVMKTASVQVEPKFLTLEQAGKYLGGLSSEAVRHMVRNGKLPVSKLGGRLFIAARDIDQAMERTQIRAL